MTSEEIIATPWENIIVDEKPIRTCSICGVLIQREVTGMEKFDGKVVCEDCYYNEAEIILRSCPIESP